MKRVKRFFEGRRNSILNTIIVLVIYGLSVQQQILVVEKENALGGVDSIDKSSILYVTKDGKLLAEAARTWFKNAHGNAIGMTKFFDEQV